MGDRLGGPDAGTAVWYLLRWSSDGRRLAFAWNSSAIRVLDVSAPDGNLITGSSLLAAIGTTDAYIGWANADGSIVVGSEVWDGHVRFGVFRAGRFTALPALPVSVPVPTGVLIGTDDW